ncbi:FtsX-like permease family protein [Jeotgalibaca porci]|uniref:FtsX-like permease family protein n=1 Tax=Jeotgalibaca porci TaxID=1868793 RepID=UPI0035A1D0BB
MKAIGASNGFIIKSVISEVFLLSGISILIGVGLTYLMTLALPEDMPFTLLPDMVVLYGVILLATSLIGSLFSIRSIIKIDPITALGRVE